MGSSDNRMNTRRGTTGVRGRPRSNKSTITRCWDCGFQSKRTFNVIRHHERIHGPAKREIQCCGKIFPNKGRFYQHCADVHPETRKSTKVSSTKYKITCATKRETARRRSSRLLKPKTERKDLDPQSYIDENKPLINFIGYPKLVNKEEVIKREVDYTDLKLDCSIEILFKGDANSPIDAKILREYLKFIDFDTFKL